MVDLCIRWQLFICYRGGHGPPWPPIDKQSDDAQWRIQTGSMESPFAKKSQTYSSFISCLDSSAVLMNEPYICCSNPATFDFAAIFNKTSKTTRII